MHLFSLFSNSTDSSSLSTMSDMIGDEWKGLAEQIFYDGNATAAIDVFCNAWVDDGTSAKYNISKTVASHTGIWGHGMTKAIGWTMIILFKTIFFEQKFDRWSGAYRFINLGTTLFPFGMAIWSIFGTMAEAGEGGISREELDLTPKVILTVGKYVLKTPRIRNWLLTGCAWGFFRYTTIRKMRSLKTFSMIEWIPGILSGILSLACSIVGEATIAAYLFGNDLQPNTLLVYAQMIHWMSTVVTGWYCYAGLIRSIFRTDLFTSFPCFIALVLAGRIAMVANAS